MLKPPRPPLGGMACFARALALCAVLVLAAGCNDERTDDCRRAGAAARSADKIFGAW